MLYESTGAQSPAVPLSKAMLAGAAPDGGLYLPQAMPSFSLEDFGDPDDLPGLAQTLLAPFFAGDTLAGALGDICAQVFNFPAPLVQLGPDKHVLELFHGPTAAFKDFGARFLAACMDRLASPAKPLSVLVATSGDTGGAVGCAFAGLQAAKVVILYPQGRVSPLQEHQLTCWPRRTVTSLRVAGDFDDCQRLVKAAFADKALAQRFGLTSANSINIGRLLPQMVYYAAASLKLFRMRGKPANFVIPSGNMGNAMACLWARRCGLPIAGVVLAQNANRPLVDYFERGVFTPRASKATLANAMDVGNPSNFERFAVALPVLNHHVRALAVSDTDIAAQIGKDARAMGRIWCPHSATAAWAYEQMKPEERDRPWVLVATAHPAKFDEVVAPQAPGGIDPCPALDAIAGLPAHVTDMPASLDALAEVLVAGAKAAL